MTYPFLHERKVNHSPTQVICGVWYHLHNLKIVKNTHGGVLPLVQLQAKKPATLLKVTLLHGCFSRFLNCANGNKSRKASHFSCILIQILVTVQTLVVARDFSDAYFFYKTQ